MKFAPMLKFTYKNLNTSGKKKKKEKRLYIKIRSSCYQDELCDKYQE